MSNTVAQNVYFVDTTATTLSGVKNISAIKYIGNASGTLQVQDANSSGAVLWQESGSTNVYNSHLNINTKDGIYIALTNGAKAYIYCK